MSEYLEIDDDTLRRLTDGYAFRSGRRDYVQCSKCNALFVNVDHMIDLMTELRETCVNEAKEDVYTALRDIFRMWRNNA